MTHFFNSYSSSLSKNKNSLTHRQQEQITGSTTKLAFPAMEDPRNPRPKESSNKGEQELIEDVVVAVGNDAELCKSTLLWAIESFQVKEVAILYVHRVARVENILRRIMGEAIKPTRKERNEMSTVLQEYDQFCAKEGVSTKHMAFFTDEPIEQKILQIVKSKGIGKLVMGAASDSKYTQNMTELKSTKAITVWKNRSASCDIWFICKGHLIYTTKASSPGHGAKRPEMMKPQQLPSVEPSTSKTQRNVDGLDRSKESEAINDSASPSTKSTGDKGKGALQQAENKSRDSIAPRDLGSGVDPRSRKAFEELLKEAMAVAEKSIRQAYVDSMKHVMAPKLLQAQDKSRDSSDPRDLGSDVNRELFEELEKANAELKFQIVEEERQSRKAVEKANEESERRREAEQELNIAAKELEGLKANRDSILEELARSMDQVARTKEELAKAKKELEGTKSQ